MSDACLEQIARGSAPRVEHGATERIEGGSRSLVQNPESLDDVPAFRHSEVIPSLGLKAEVQLAEVMKRREHHEARDSDRVKVVTTSVPREPVAPGWQLEQGGADGCHIGAVIDQRMPGDDLVGDGVALELAPESPRWPLHRRAPA